MGLGGGDSATIRPWTLLPREPGQCRGERVEVTGYREESGSPHIIADIVVNFLNNYLLISCVCVCNTCHIKHDYYLRFEVFTAVVMKSVIFWDVTPCSLLTTDVSEEHRLHLQGRRK
jgi:hypothetical protein